MARNRYLRRKDFRQYLVEMEEYHAVVGVTRDIHKCPIANYLEHLTKREWHTSALACVPQVRSEVEDHEFKTPKWARLFIRNLDRHFGKRPRPVTAEEVLYVLDEYAA